VAPPTIEQETAAYLGGGLTVTSDDPSINGTYGVVSPQNLNINSIITSLANGNGLPLSISQVTVFDMDGVPHQFATQEIVAFSVAVRDFVQGCRLYAHGQADSLPPNTVQIESLALPVNTTAPVVAQTIGVLTCTQGDWDGVPKNFDYEWRSNWVTTVGTDSPTYVIDAANDVGQTFDCIVTASNIFGAVQAASNAIVVVDPSSTRNQP
jgi:hypothetical protein